MSGQSSFAFDRPVRTMADTSLEAFARIRPTLNERETLVFLALCDHDAFGTGLTGGELAARMGVPVTHVRPRLTGLEAKGWIQKLPARTSRAEWETWCHPYTNVVPRAAVERVRSTQEQGKS